MTSNYNKFPTVQVSKSPADVARGVDAIADAILRAASDRRVIVIETYPGADVRAIVEAIQKRSDLIAIDAATCFKTQDGILRLTQADVTDDPVFGRITQLQLLDFFDTSKLEDMRRETASGRRILFGCGASLIHPGDLLVYADMARWELQTRMRRNEIDNLGLSNKTERWSLQYKRAYFVDWRAADRHKRQLYDRINFLLDTNTPADLKMIAGEQFRSSLKHTSTRPFRVVPFFDPAPWGGQWMKEVCDLDRSAANYGWCFDCVPEENSLFLGFGDVRVEVPSIDLVFAHPRELLGEDIFNRFGAEFPIRFDFLDTMAGGNLSFQVHPLTAYIREHFAMSYTQDESYYMLDAKDDASVYLGLRDGVDPAEMSHQLREAASGKATFDADRFANKFAARKHDHFLIPAGTVHCSGANSMVLEISATPYIFTFKMWDWGRLGLDGRPRPVHLDHGLANVQWDRTTDWTKKNLVNRVTQIRAGDGWREEVTGLHDLEFIETRRHWFKKIVPHKTRGNLNVLNLVEGEEAIVESPTGAFEPFVVHYAETFIVPAAVGEYTIRPHGPAVGKECGTMKAFVRPVLVKK